MSTHEHPVLRSRVIVALDDMNPSAAYALSRQVSGQAWGFKANSLLDSTESPRHVTFNLGLRGGVFIDIKGLDIPSTIANRVREHSLNEAHLITLHASGGVEMLKAGVAAFEMSKTKSTQLGILAVTVLTTFDDETCEAVYGSPVEATIDRFAAFAAEAGVHGIVCSPTDVARIRKQYGDTFTYVTPGIRPAGSEANDQQRFDTPAAAIKNGADLLVVGRPITQHQDPSAALANINQEVDTALASQT